MCFRYISHVGASWPHGLHRNVDITHHTSREPENGQENQCESFIHLWFLPQCPRTRFALRIMRYNAISHTQHKKFHITGDVSTGNSRGLKFTQTRVRRLPHVVFPQKRMPSDWLNCTTRKQASLASATPNSRRVIFGKGYALVKMKRASKVAATQERYPQPL